MAKKAGRSLVINASIARASGLPGASHPVAKACRDFLRGVLLICHRVVITPAIAREWKDHSSHFARTWRVSMEARKKVVRPDVSKDTSFEASLGQAASGEKARAVLLKDAHLIQAALAGDSIVVSADNEARDAFTKAAASVTDIQGIVWVNPSEEKDPCQWLRDGARPENSRLLGRPGSQPPPVK